MNVSVVCMTYTPFSYVYHLFVELRFCQADCIGGAAKRHTSPLLVPVPLLDLHFLLVGAIFKPPSGVGLFSQHGLPPSPVILLPLPICMFFILLECTSRSIDIWHQAWVVTTIVPPGRLATPQHTRWISI